MNYVNALRLDQKQHVKLVHAANHIMSLFSSCATPEKPRIESETFHQTNWPLAAWAASQAMYNLKRKCSAMPQGHCAALIR